jgi:uncharacterized membrane protein YbhN (UPF0104 family)
MLAGLPALFLAALIGLQLLIAGYTLTLADGAAEAGAAAGAAGLEAREAARDALPEWARERAEVEVRGGRVEVELRPPAPLAALAERLAVTSVAWARPVGEGR